MTHKSWKTAPFRYHLLAREMDTSSRWWRPLTSIALSFALYSGGVVVLISLILATAAIAEHLGGGVAWSTTEEFTDPTRPLDMVAMLGLVALMLPAAVLGSRWGGRAPGIIHSTSRRIRWRLIWRPAAVVFPIYTIWIAATFLLTGTEGFSWPGLNLRTTVVLAVIVVLTPLQCAAEEYVFRGLAQQTLGTWLKSPAWGILVPVPFFMIGHEYGWLGQIDIAVFAICMGLLVWKSGGLELAIVLHTANNLNLFLLSPFNPSILGQGDVEPLQLLMSATLTVVMTAAAWMWLSRTDTRRGLTLMEPRDQPEETAHPVVV